MNTLLPTEFLDTLVRFVICVIVNWSIIFCLYYRKSHRRDFSFTFMMMTVAIFFLVYFMMGMDRGKATMGVGLGLFGIFSIMRYRTDSMPVREMTYLFVIICLAVIHAMATESVEEPSIGSDTMAMSYAELLTVDAITIVCLYICEHFLKAQSTKLIQYDRIELITPERRQELIEDIKKRTGLNVTHIDIGAIDFIKDMAMLKVHYQGQNNTVNSVLKLYKDELKEF